MTLKSTYLPTRPVNVGRALRMTNVFVIGSGSSIEKRPSAWRTRPICKRLSPLGVWMKNPSFQPATTGGAAGAGAGGAGVCAATMLATAQTRRTALQRSP